MRLGFKVGFQHHGPWTPLLGGPPTFTSPPVQRQRDSLMKLELSCPESLPSTPTSASIQPVRLWLPPLQAWGHSPGSGCKWGIISLLHGGVGAANPLPAKRHA